MTTETAELTVEQVEAQFTAGFKAAAGETPEVPKETTVAIDEPKGEDTVAPAGEETIAAEEPRVFAGLTEQQLNDVILKANRVDEIEGKITALHDHVFGKIGEVQASVKALQANPSSGTAIKLTKESLKRLGENYPELADDLAQDLTEALKGGGSDTSANLQAILDEFNAKVEERFVKANEGISAMDAKIEKRILSGLHEDWPEVVKSEKYAAWLAGQSTDYQKRINDSWDAYEIAKSITKFKGDIAQKPHPSGKRLEDAIQPTNGTPSATVVEDAEAQFSKGFLSVAGRK